MRVWRTFQSFLCALLRSVLLLMAPLVAHAAPAPVVPAEPCVLVGPATLGPSRLIAHRAHFDCVQGQVGVRGAVIWGLVSNLSLSVDPADPWELRHEYTQADRQTLWVRYADGRVVLAPSDRTSARRTFSPGKMSFALPSEQGMITDILIRVEGLRNQRGLAAGIELKTGRAALEGDLVVLFIYGLLAGVVGVLLVYNVALYATLRYRFILAYCVSGIAMLLMGLCWSGGIFVFVPDLDSTEQISLTMLGTVAMVGSAVVFLAAFVEREHRPRWPLRATFAINAIGLASCVVRLIDSRFAWEAMDLLTYWSIVATFLGLLVSATFAWRKGSRSAKIYLLAWSLPILLGMTRAIWGMGYIGGVSTVVAMSPLIFAAFEALMSAFAVAWRVGQLRSERDEAHAMQAQLQHAADTDVLTGLLNRRAFIDRAMALSPASQLRHRLIVVDIDRFKLVNDRYGHQAGDDVLACVAQSLAQTAPSGAIVGRIGGEEFALLVPALAIDPLPDQLCRAVEKAATPDGLTATISVGVADGPIADEATWRLLYHAADQALYRSKNGGRNRVSHAPRAVAA